MKNRVCECGREVEKYCRLCSECRSINAQISKDIYSISDNYKISQNKYNKSEKGKSARHKAEKKWRENNSEYKSEEKKKWNLANRGKIKEYNRKYYANKKISNIIILLIFIFNFSCQKIEVENKREMYLFNTVIIDGILYLSYTDGKECKFIKMEE